LGCADRQAVVTPIPDRSRIAGEWIAPALDHLTRDPRLPSSHAHCPAPSEYTIDQHVAPHQRFGRDAPAAERVVGRHSSAVAQYHLPTGSRQLRQRGVVMSDSRAQSSRRASNRTAVRPRTARERIGPPGHATRRRRSRRVLDLLNASSISVHPPRHIELLDPAVVVSRYARMAPSR
jgi:hypothetical protein